MVRELGREIVGESGFSRFRLFNLTSLTLGRANPLTPCQHTFLTNSLFCHLILRLSDTLTP